VTGNDPHNPTSPHTDSDVVRQAGRAEEFGKMKKIGEKGEGRREWGRRATKTRGIGEKANLSCSRW
jgi:hypothetical protein